MPKSVLDEPRFRNEEAAYAYVESIVWEGGRVCPKCGIIGESKPLNGKSTRIGVYKCYACRKPFTVKVGTIFEVQPCAAAHLVAGHALDVQQQEGV